MKPGFILIAAGYGSFRAGPNGPHPKVLEEISGRVMLEHSLRAAQAAGIIDVAVVVNPLFGPQIEAALDPFIAQSDMRVRFMTSLDRYGAAHAAMLGARILLKNGIDRALIAYGDMPLWSSGTMSDVLDAMGDATITMLTVIRSPRYPTFDRYGRILRDRVGAIWRVKETNDSTLTNEERMLTRVNPCLWAWDLDWLDRHVEFIEPVAHPDGLVPERHLPPLVEIAYRNNRPIRWLTLRTDRMHEAHGVNTWEELELIRSMFVPA